MSLHKVIDPGVPTALKVLIRSCFGLIFFSPFILKEGFNALRPRNIKLHLIRISFMTLAMGGTYYTYANLPLSEATSIGFSGPIFTAILSYFILNDRLSFSQWIAIVIGYLGVLILIDPSGEINNTIYVAILANIFTGLNLIYVKKLTEHESKATIVILGNIGVIITTFVWSLIYWIISTSPASALIWQLPSMTDVLLMLGMGLLGALSQFAYISALKHSSPSFLGPFEYSRLVIAIPIGLILGDAFPQAQQIIGVIIIIASTLYLSLKGTRHG